MDTDRYLHARYGQPVRFDFDAIIVAIQKAGRTILYIGRQYRSTVRAAQKRRQPHCFQREQHRSRYHTAYECVRIKLHYTVAVRVFKMYYTIRIDTLFIMILNTISSRSPGTDFIKRTTKTNYVQNRFASAACCIKSNAERDLILMYR